MDHDKNSTFFKNNSVLKEAEEFLREVQTIEKINKRSIDLPRNIKELEYRKEATQSDDSLKNYENVSKSVAYDKLVSNELIKIETFKSKDKSIKMSSSKKILKTEISYENSENNELKLIENMNNLKEKNLKLEEENSQLIINLEKLNDKIGKENENSLKEIEELKRIIEDNKMMINALTVKNNFLVDENKELNMNLGLKQKELDFLQTQITNFENIIKTLKEEFESRYKLYREEIESIRKEKDKLSAENLDLESKFKIEKNTLIKEYNDKIYQFKEKERSRIKDIEVLLTKLEIENQDLKTKFDSFVKSRNNNFDTISKDNYLHLLKNSKSENTQVQGKKMSYKNKENYHNFKLLKEEIENLEQRIYKNNLILRNFEFSKNKGNEESKSMIYSIMKQLEEDSEYLLQLKKKSIDMNKNTY